MALIRVAILRDDKVINVALVDSMNVPSHLITYPIVDDSVQVGFIWADGEWVNPTPAAHIQTSEELAFEERTKRNELLTASDWTMLNNSPLSESVLLDWKIYREDLRNITEQPAFPESIIWPSTPFIE